MRDLVKLIDKQKRKPIYTDFEDEMSTDTGVEQLGFGVSGDFEKFRAKVQANQVRIHFESATVSDETARSAGDDAREAHAATSMAPAIFPFRGDHLAKWPYNCGIDFYVSDCFLLFAF